MEFNELKGTDIIWIPYIPKHWDIIKVRHLFKETTTKGFPNEPLLVASQEHGVVNKDVFGRRTMEATKDFHLLKLVEKGDFVISLRSFQGGIELAHERGIISPAYTILKERRNIDKRYFKHLFKSKPFISLLTLCVKGIRDGQNIDYPTFKGEYLPLPPVEEQERIGKYLDRKTKQIQEFISKKECLIELLEERRKEYIDNITHNIERLEYSSKPLKYLVNFISEQTNKKEDDEEYIALENIESWTGRLDLSVGNSEFESNVKRFTQDDILFNKLRPYLAKVVIPNFKGVCVGEILVLRSRKEISKEFLFYTLISRRFIDLVDSSTFGSKMPRASWEFIGKINIQYPNNITEQARIVQQIRKEEEKIEKLKAKYKAEINQLIEYQESLITQIVTGQLQVPKQKAESTKANWEFKEAVLIAFLTNKCATAEYPLGRKRYTKFSYLFHRHTDNKIEKYTNKAAGPYNHETKYKGPEKIAKQNKYIQEIKKGKFNGFVPDNNIEKALNYFSKYWTEEDVAWFDKNKFLSNDKLELIATVDKAILDLQKQNKSSSLENVKTYIQESEEWKAKLKREIFSDDNIRQTIKELDSFFS